MVKNSQRNNIVGILVLPLLPLLSVIGCGGGGSSSKSKSQLKQSASVAKPVLTNLSSPHISNESSLLAIGSCTVGNTIKLSGDDTQSTSCSDGAFSFTINKASDATYTFSLTATNGTSESGTTTQQWIRDTQAPSDPSINSPGASPHTSGDNSIVIQGSCETDATVQVTDVDAASTTEISCTSGTFEYTSSNKTLDGDYDFQISQTDPASNESGTVTWRWTRSTLIPATPTLTSPTTDPYYSKTSSLSLNGTCIPDYTVELSGDDSQSTTCSHPAGTYHFDVSVAQEGSSSYSILQHDQLGGQNSSAETLTWIYDATAPGGPSISGPTAVASGASGSYTSVGDITILGTCESGATVNLTGSETQSMACTSSAYSFGVTASCGQAKSYSIAQTDPAGNTSASTSLGWTKDCSVMPDPTIVSPATQPYASGSTTLAITGSCETGMTVEIGGDVTASEAGGSLQTTCVSSAYSFTVDKSADTQPAIRYDFTLKQQDLPSSPTKVSNLVPLVWIRNGANQTVALYHFDSATLATTDSSLYGDSTLTDTSSASIAGKYGESRDFIPNSFMSAANNDAQRTPRHFMTIETWISIDAIPASNRSYVIAEKENVWKLALTRQGGSNKLFFEFLAAEDLGNGSCGTMTQVKTSPVTLTTGVLQKLVVTFELGSVTIYHDNVAIGTGTIGVAGSAELCDVSPGALYLGSDSGTADYLDGQLDEFSISQSIRDPARTGPFTAD